MIWKLILLGVIGFAGGISVAGGVFAFISILEMLPRLANRVYFLENCIFLGGVTGAVLTVFHISIPFGSATLAVFGLFSGIFVGCLAMALAETLKVIPVLVQRVKLATGLPLVILALALGKAIACFYQLYFRMQH